MSTEGIQRARALQNAAKLSVDLMAIGLKATPEDAPDVRAALLRAVRDQGIPQTTAQQLIGAALATGDRTLSTPWAEYAAGATPQAKQKVAAAIRAVREEQDDRVIAELQALDIAGLYTDSEDDEPAAPLPVAQTPRLAPGTAASAPFTPSSEPPGSASKPPRPARSAAITARVTAPPLARTLTMPSPAASAAPPATPAPAPAPADATTPARPARPGAAAANLAQLQADVLAALNRGTLRNEDETELLLNALQDNPLTAALYREGTLAARDLIQPGYADSMEKRLRDRAASQQGQRARTMSARRSATLPIPRGLPAPDSTGLKRYRRPHFADPDA